MVVEDINAPQPVSGGLRSINIPASFSIREVDGRRGGPGGAGRGGPDFPHRGGPDFPHRGGPDFPHRGPPKPDDQVPIPGKPDAPKPDAPKPDAPKPDGPKAEDPQPIEDAALGPVLGKFVGAFKGTGFNTIFRPNNNFNGNLSLDNLLEINLTSETLQFLAGNVLGDIPNRGFDNQPDVFLKGVPYTQTISDKLNNVTGKADLPDKGTGDPNGPHAVDIHFEQGLFLRTPATTSPDIKSATISRLGSIPHGTTINAQAFEPTASIASRPKIDDVKIVPSFIGVQSREVPFANMSNTGDITGEGLRKPANLKPFIDAGTITIDTLNNPNKILRDINAKKNIVSHFTFTVSTKPTSQLPGGGVANIAFLGSGAKNPPTAATGNANAVAVTCQYWVSTIVHDVVVKAGDYDKNPQSPDLSPEETKQGIKAPKFRVELNKKVSKDTVIKVPSTQIQYSQNVTLDFGVLSWPHISVATLIPAQPLLVKANSPFLADLK
jgi:hypothetical protein